MSKQNNLTEGFKFLEDTLVFEVNAHESLKRVYMLQYSLKDEGEEEKKEALREQLPKLEALLD